MSDTTNAAPPPPPRRRLRSWSLALVLSLVLIAGWAMFLVLAPTPQVLPPSAPVVVAPLPAEEGMH